jgi:DNA-binding NarL/FixJ family response regulator
MMGGSEVISQLAGRYIWPRPVFAPDAGDAPVAAVRNEKVLIVEDDHLVAIEAESALLEAGFEIAGIAATSEEAISLARAEKPDIVVMDIRLAGKRDGIDTAIQLFTEMGLRSVFASAHSDSASRARAEAARPLGWLSKPYQPEALVKAVAKGITELKHS